MPLSRLPKGSEEVHGAFLQQRRCHPSFHSRSPLQLAVQVVQTSPRFGGARVSMTIGKLVDVLWCNPCSSRPNALIICFASASQTMFRSWLVQSPESLSMERNSLAHAVKLQWRTLRPKEVANGQNLCVGREKSDQPERDFRGRWREELDRSGMNREKHRWNCRGWLMRVLAIRSLLVYGLADGRSARRAEAESVA